MASDKQAKLAADITSKIGEKADGLPEELGEAIMEMITPVQHDLAKLIGDPESVSTKTASTVIDTLFAAKDAVPMDEYRFRMINDDWFVVGPDGSQPWDDVTVTKANGTTKVATIAEKVETTGLNARYTTVPPWEVKKVRAAQDENEWGEVRTRLAALHQRFGTKRLRTAWVPADGENDLDFIRWGESQVLRVIGGHADTPLALGHAELALDRIEAMTDDEVVAAASLFGSEMGHCGRCSRHLTDVVSRRLGIGPECRAKDGWEAFAEAEATIRAEVAAEKAASTDEGETHDEDSSS